MTVCQIYERDAGRSYPRTCPTCKMTGPCAKGLDRKGMADRIEALEAKLAKAVEALERTPDAVRRTTLDDGPRLPEDSLGVWLVALDACANVTQAHVSATIAELTGGKDDVCA